MAILRIVTRQTGILWEVEEGSATHKRCLANPKQYEILAPGQDGVKAPEVAMPVEEKAAKKKLEKSG